MTAIVESSTLRPRAHQREALAALVAAYTTGAARLQLRAACGTGKTLIGLWLAGELGARTVVVFEPSIALVGQTIAQWTAAGPPVRALAVCSDPTTSASRAEIGIDGIDPFAGAHDAAGVTTRAGVVARFLDQGENGAAGLSVVVSTYHSAQVVAEALRLTDHVGTVDLVVADEAHHLAGRTDARFVPVLRDDVLPARRRLFQTATPIVLGNLAVGIDPIDELSGVTSRVRSMDDERIFGPIAYNLPAGDAITRGLLADYRVVVAAPRENLGAAAVPDRAALAALVDTVAKYGVRRVLTFHNRVAGARSFAARVGELGEVDGTRIRGFAVDGSMPDVERRRILDELADSDEGRAVTVVASSQCLREGIDVPAVDAVVFADPRTSATGIVQAIGRALRPHPDKALGTIVVPLVVDPTTTDDQDALADSAYRHVWRVLRGLRAHDARVAFDLDRARQSSGKGVFDRDHVAWLDVVGEDPHAVVARLLERTSPAWEMYYGLLVEAVEGRGSVAAITSDTVLGGKRLGQWMCVQRARYGERVLDPDRVRRLEAVPGWRWDAVHAADERSLTELDKVVEQCGSLAENAAGASIYAGFTDGLGRPLDRWVATQIFKYRDAEISAWLRDELQARPGWTWDLLDPTDNAAFEAFRLFVAWEGHGDVGPDHVEDDQPVGQWLQNVRRRKLTGTLSPALEAMLLAAMPTGGNGERRFLWQTSETRWHLGITAAQQYVAREGGIEDLPNGHAEIVDGHPVNLYQWTRRLRHLHNRGVLAAERVAAVEQIPGWRWHCETGGRHRVRIADPIDLGDVPHGRRGFHAGCHCATCVNEQRSYTRAAAREQARKYRADWVDARDVGAHLNRLLAADGTVDRSARIVTAGALAAAAGVNVGLVRGLLSGKEKRCHPLHRRALLALTEDEVRAVRTVPGSRGRVGIAGRGVRVDPASTWAIVDELTSHGWTAAAIAAALGYRRRSRLPFTRESVSADHAKMVGLLYDSLDGNLAAPSTPLRIPRRRNDEEAERFARSLLEQGYQVTHVAKRTCLSIALVSAIHTTTCGTEKVA